MAGGGKKTGGKGGGGGRGGADNIKEKNIPDISQQQNLDDDSEDMETSRGGPGVFSKMNAKSRQRQPAQKKELGESGGVPARGKNAKKSTKQQTLPPSSSGDEDEESDWETSMMAKDAGGTGKRAARAYDALRSGKGGAGGLSDTPGGGGASSGGEELRKRNLKKEKPKSAPRSGKKKENKEGGGLSSSVCSCIKSFVFDSSTPLRSRAVRWLANACIAAAILGVFVLKAAEEYYGQDEDTGGQQTEQHLAALQLDSGASEADIRKAYRTLSMRWHPDKNPGCTGCQARFTEVAVAYEYLMKKKKKDEKESGGQGDARGDGGGEGDEKLHRTTSKDIVDLTVLRPSDVFYPATDRHVWTIMLHNDKDEFSGHVNEMWEETALTLGKYFKYGVINVRRNKDLSKRLPVNIKIFPAILVMGSGMHPEVYPNIGRPSVENIHAFISKSFPNKISTLYSASDVQSFLSSKSVGGQSSLSALSQPYKILVLSPPGSSSSSSSPSLMLRHAAYKLLPLFSFGYVVNTRGLYADKTAKEDLFNALRNPPTWLSPPRSGNTEGGGKEKQGPNFVLPFNLKEEDLLTSAIFALFVDEGTAGGVRTYVEKLPLSKSKEGQKVLFHQLNHLLASFQQHVHPYLYQQNAALLCRGTLQQRVFTLVRVESGGRRDAATAEDEKAEQAHTPADSVLSLEEIGKLLESSRTKFLAASGVAGGADKDKAKKREKGEEESEESKEDEEEEEPSADFDDEASKDGSFYIQLVRLSLDSPQLLPSLPGLPKNSPFYELWKEDLGFSRLFLLDLDGSRFARIAPSPSSASSSSSSKEAAQRRILSHLYQVLESQQYQSKGEDEDEEDEGHDTRHARRQEEKGNAGKFGRVVFEPLPDFCDGQRFVKKCLASAAPAWYWEVLASCLDLSFTQVAVILGLVASLYFFGSSLSSEMVVLLVLGGSLLAGGLTNLQAVFSFLMGGGRSHS